MVKAFQGVWEEAIKRKVSLRCGAYVVAIERLAEVYRYRGIFP